MLVSCVAYEDGRRLCDISIAEIRSYMNRPNSFVWVALHDPEPDELHHLQAEFDLHPLAVEDANHGQQRPKVEEYGTSLFAVVQMLELREGDVHVGDVTIFAGERYVLSIRRNASRGFSEVRARAEQEPHLLRFGPGYVLYALMDSVVDRYFPVIAALEDEAEELEARIFSGNTTRAQIEALYALKRKLTVIAHAVRPLLEGTSKLTAGRVPPLCTGLVDYFRDVYDHLIRLDQEVDNLRDTMTTAITVNLSLITIQESENTKTLAAYAALFAVPTMIAGVYGMNFTHMPEIDWRYGYPFAVGLMVAIDLYLFYRFRKARWL
jgi:magnesium transporter